MKDKKTMDNFRSLLRTMQIVQLILCTIFIAVMLFMDFSLLRERRENRNLGDVNNVVKISEDICKEEEPEVRKPMTDEELYQSYVDDICKDYPNVDPSIIKAIIYQESRYKPDVQNGDHVGLMQISTYWHTQRASDLGVTDWFDPYSNIKVGVDLFSELMKNFEDVGLRLMVYNSGYNDAFAHHDAGTLSNYATSVMEKAKEYA